MIISLNSCEASSAKKHIISNPVLFFSWQGILASSYQHNGHGDRLTQNGVQYTLDLNAGLTQVLSDGTNTYTYGLGRISQTNTTTEYFLGDALGSVRQMTDPTSEVTFTQSYDPYGTVTTSAGTSQIAYGFTGEQYSAETQMVYLRARYYSPLDGRFSTRDTWSGDVMRPLSLNRWGYVEGNPVNLTDPLGNSIYSGICMGQVFTNGLLLNMSAERLIEHCQNFYSQSFWGNNGVPGGIGPYDCNTLNQTPYRKPTTSGELFGDYICERGPNHVDFNGSDNLTHKLARSIALNKVRQKFYTNGRANLPRHEEKFGNPRLYINEWNDLRTDPEFPIVHILGSFWVSVSSSIGNRIRIKVENRTDLASGTHFIERFPPPGQERTPYSLQSYIHDHPSEKNWSAAWIINTHSEIVSILSPRERSQTGHGMGGGNFDQTYTWTEANVQCEMQDMPWPIYLNYLNIGNDDQIAFAP